MLQSGGNIFRIKISKGDNPVGSPLPYVQITKVSDGSILYANAATETSGVVEDVGLILEAGTQYEIKAVADGNDNQPSSSIPYAVVSTSFKIPGGISNVDVGGLRINSIKNYDINGTITNTETYTYGINDESGGGVQLSVLSADNFARSTLCTNSDYGNYTYSMTNTYSNNSFYPMQTLNGSPVGYPTVTVYNGDQTQNVGKTVYKYQISLDQVLVAPRTVRPVPVTWKNGDPVYIGKYRNVGSNQYSLVSDQTMQYELIDRAGGMGTVIQLATEPIGDINTCSYFTSPTIDNSLGYPRVFSGGGVCEWFPNWFTWYDYPISTGSRVLSETVNNAYAPDGVTKVSTVTDYFYDNLNHVYPTRIVTTNSKGESIKKTLNYPEDMVIAGKDPTGIYNSMVSANMISPVIEQFQFKDATQLSYSKTNYATFNVSKIEPKSVEVQTRTNPSEIRLEYLGYDSKENIQAVIKDNGPKMGYKWGYNQQYPIAEIKNADNTEFYFENFEDNPAATVGVANTGDRYYSGASYTVTWSLPNSRSYVISYWYLNAGVWNFKSEQPFTGSITLNTGSGYDDIRIYPKDAQMTTYTYATLTGITSQCDINNRITFYEYDNFQRLRLIRDQDRNIIKRFDYQYQQLQ